VATSTAKRVLVYRFDRQPVEAIVNPGDYLRDLQMELITAGGNLQKLAYSEVKAVCFAKEPGRPDLFTDEHAFERRPKMAGLWTRFIFRDSDWLEGVLPHNLLDWPPQGYVITPPRAGLTRQLVFIPRQALAATHLLGVVGVPSNEKRPKRTETGEEEQQLTMFDREPTHSHAG
jgi:hypothetical protein